MVPVYRVSNLAAYARWRNEEGEDIGWLMNSIFSEQSTEAMSRGTAFHAALEKISIGEYSTVESEGYIFAFTCDAEISLPKTRELRRSKDYGGIIVSGKCDGIEGKHIIDHKTVSGGFDAEYHLDGWQHKFYMDIFGVDRFDWHVWEVGPINDHQKAIDTFLPGAPPSGEHAIDDYNSAVVELSEMETYEVYAHHLLTQYRYPGMEEDCRRLAWEFRDFALRMGWKGLSI